MTNWTDNPFPVAPWDSAGLPPRTMDERCARHKHCAYRDDDPVLCPLCHTTLEKCGGKHGGRPADGWGEHTKRGERVLVAAGGSTLRAGQYFDPHKQGQANSPGPLPPPGASEHVSSTHPNQSQELQPA